MGEEKRGSDNWPHNSSLPVEWTEFGDRDFYFAEYSTVGAIPSILIDTLSSGTTDKDLQDCFSKVFSQTAFLIKRNRDALKCKEARFAAVILEKILIRGNTPLPTLGFERQALRVHELSGMVRELDDDDPEIGWESDEVVDLKSIVQLAIDRDDFVLDPAFEFHANRPDCVLGSEAEAKFLNDWVPRELGCSAGQWFIPQVRFGSLLESRGRMSSSGDSRRIDFLFSHPCTPPIAIEIDGSQHDDEPHIDERRDQLLQSVGIEVIRVSTRELEAESGPSLDKIHQRLHGLFTKTKSLEANQQVASLAKSCTTAAKVQYAIVGALWRGWLRPGKHWEIVINNATQPLEAGILDLLKMLEAIEVIYGIQVSPSQYSIRLLSDGKLINLPDMPPVQGSAEIGCEERDSFQISIEVNRGPFHKICRKSNFDYVIRSAYLPVDLISSPKPTLDGSYSADALNNQSGSPTHLALRRFLRHVFRKSEFREGQLQGLVNALRKIDTIILLPTGGGKSIIYQLAGLLMPGITLVVDPLIALMEDQVEGLQSYGIDRAIAIFSTNKEDQDRKFRLIEKGQYHYVLISPERLQTKPFRSSLHSLAEDNPINLAVIDEAHCVSEWGHDFRPAYLSLANSLRNLSSFDGDSGPPLLALTGTASRAVLRDMINDLEIDKNRSNSLIRPDSFDRPEIKFKVIRTSPGLSDARLKRELQRQPLDFGIPLADFYKPRRRNTNSGIIFVPTLWEVDKILKLVVGLIPTEVTYYSGGPPPSFTESTSEWKKVKRENARNFKQNQSPILVATKAYGMGIDKPNIRYTIHYGIPSSLEQYYQEAGRAGRDRKEAVSILILGEISRKRSDQLLDPDLDIENLRERHDEIARPFDARDDITRALYFHLEGFKGITAELEDIEKLVATIMPRVPFIPISILFSDKNKARKEKSIYRLYKLGFIKDYTVDWGKKEFLVTTNRFDFQKFREKFLDYVRNIAPGKLRSTRRKVDSIDPEIHNRAIIDLAKILIEFTYDEIERARRRAIQESILLARQSKSDSDVRRRLLDYLQEEIGYEKIDELLQREQVDLHEWINLIDKIQNPIEAGELRGLCIRALESSADHPGLLFVRGVAETMTADYYWNVASMEISRAIKVGIEKYDVTTEHIANVIQRLFNQIRDDSAVTKDKLYQIETSLTMALLDVAENRDDSTVNFAEKIAHEQGAQSDIPEVKAILLCYHLGQVIEQLEDIWYSTSQDLENISLTWDSRRSKPNSTLP